ncbi:4348_t:CDS:2 [Rhizophagus irregularis]|nr:4348_t:CDS:2 [Rhizophagus irregularis]
MSNSKLSQVYQVIVQDLEEVLESNFFKEDTTRVLKDIKDTWVKMSSLQSLFSLYKQERVTKYQRGIAKVTDVEIDKWVEESVNVGKEKGEPSVRRSPRPMKRVNYAEMDGSDEENYFAKISLNKRV